MFDFTPAFRADEQVLGDYPATSHWLVGTYLDGRNTHLWLTNQRLISKVGFGPALSHWLRQATISEEPVAHRTLVQLKTADGQTYWYSVANQTQFLAALQAAQTQAPEIPQDALLVAPAGQDFRRIWWIAVGIGLAGFLCLVCLFGAFFAWNLYLVAGR